uniref:Uncharacterized protein n=1 Tax=Anguilla anguilla TaxID=7936 RepID=A0A0E9Q7B4_ANGAN
MMIICSIKWLQIYFTTELIIKKTVRT